MNFFIYLSKSTKAVWIRSLTFFNLFTAFLKHSCNLSSVKGDPPLKMKDKQTVTEQQNNLMSPASLAEFATYWSLHLRLLQESKQMLTQPVSKGNKMAGMN